MSDTILSGDFTVYYLAETRQKRIVWSGSATGTRTVNELYSAMANLLDELNQIDDGTALSAQTPTEYTVGIIDPSDKDPWFIDRTTVEHLTGGALKTSGWLRASGSNTGIVCVTRAGTNIVAGDIGQTITHADGDSGTLLDVYGTTLWIRPASYAAANNWDSTSGNITCNGHVDTQAAAAVSGENLWANIYTLGTIEPYTYMYIFQNGAKIGKYKDSANVWWSEGHVDLLVCVKNMGTEIDEGYITVFARQYHKSYDNYIVDLTAGGRNPIPLATGNDLNNDTGLRAFTGSGGSGTFTVANYMYVGASWAAATAKGVITAVGGSGASPVLSYYLIGTGTDFANLDVVHEYTGLADGDGGCTASAPADIGPATYTVTITHGFTSAYDINEDGSHENYSIMVDLADTYTVKQGYEFSKYVTKRNYSATGSTDGIAGECYIGSEYRINYSTITGSIAEGSTVTQVSSSATGVVVGHNTADKQLILRNTRGTFNNTNDIRVDVSNYVSTPTCTQITPIKAAPFGTFAGGKWFCAPGVVLVNYLASDGNNFQLVDDDGNVVVAPTKVTVSVTNSRLGDRIAVFRLTDTVANGGIIDKEEYAGTAQSSGSSTLVVGSAITSDTPGKSTGGVLRLVDTTASQEYRIRYSSWSSVTFTLAYSTGSAAAGTNTTTIVSTGSFTNSKVGDLIHNTTRTATTYVTEVTSADQVTVFPAVTGQTTSDDFRINCLPVDTTTGDFVYVPFMDVYETVGSDLTPGSEAVSVTYTTEIPVLVRARQAGSILPYEGENSIKSTGMSVPIIRTADTIYTAE